MRNAISFEDVRKLWKGAGLSGCIQLVFDGQRRQLFCQYKMECKTEGFFVFLHRNAPPKLLTHFPNQMGGDSGELTIYDNIAI